MSSVSLDFSPLLPQELGPKLYDAAAAWRAANVSQDAIILPLFTGVKGFELDVFAVRRNVNAIGQAPISLCQDISSYSQVFASVAGAVKDRQTLAASLGALVNRWHSLDPNDLTSPKSEIAGLLGYDETEIKDISAELSAFSDKIAKWTTHSTDALFGSSLFDSATRILEPIANFPFTVDGIARFADAFGLPIRAVNVPLKKVFEKSFIIGNPISTPDTVATSVSTVRERIREYFLNIEKVLRDVDNVVSSLEAVASNALLIPDGIKEFAAGQLSDSPVDADTAKEAWKEAGAAAEDFVSAYAGKLSVRSSSLGINTFAARPTSADVESALGPPSYGVSILSGLASQTLSTSEQLATVLTLPYNSDFKVTVDDAEISLFQALLNVKTTYEGIQSRTIPVARNIQTFSLMQKTILPVFGSDLPVPPAELFNTWSSLAESYRDNATQVAADCQALLGTFRQQVSILKSNLTAVKTRIAADKAELAAAQKAYDDLKAQMLVDGILAVVLTAGAIAAAYSGQGELIGELGGNAGKTFSKVVEDDIKAGEMNLLIRKIERIIAIAENTGRELDKAIPLVIGVADFMMQIGNAWADINAHLTIADNRYDSWKDAELLTPDFLKTLASRWASYETEAVRYVDRILGIQTPTTLNMLSISLSGISDKEFKSVNFSTENASDSHALRKFHQLNNDPQLRSLMAPATTEAHIEKFNALYAKALDDQFYNAIKAPLVIIDANRQSFINSGAQYRQAADILQSLYPQDANNLRDLASRIDSDVIPPITECVNFYKTFANNQIAALSVTPTKAGLENLAAQNAQSAAEGAQKASAAQTKVLDFKNQSVLVNTSMIQRHNELQLTMIGVEQELSAKQAELAKYQPLSWMPGIGDLIRVIIEAVTHNEEQARDLKRQMGNLEQAISQVDAAGRVSEAALNNIVSLTQSWANLTQEAKDLSAYLKIIAVVPETASALAADATNTWTILNLMLARW